MRRLINWFLQLSTSNEVNMFSKDEEEAVTRFEHYQSLDPFPAIPAALLNSADISDYIATTGMLYPFDEADLKPASYQVNFGGKCVSWDKNGEKKVFQINRGENFILENNSIAFVTLEPFFRLPDYIAVRFNLKISFVYRGLLLGTGPLVDPGFVGRLSIPLHNLTTNDYVIRGGEPLIWVEFTKLSPNPRWLGLSRESPSRRGTYFPFPAEKLERQDVEDYLYRAEAHRPIRSSIPAAVNNAQRAAEQAGNRLRTFERRISIGGLVGAIALFIALVALAVQVHSVIQDSIIYVAGARMELSQTRAGSQTASPILIDQQRIQSLENEVQILKQRIEQLARATPLPTSVVNATSLPTPPQSTVNP
jgi:deoxycytidine triphosphate deaminase